MVKQNLIWTIGHSTRSLEYLIQMLQSFEIKILADIRSFPGSRRYPQFNKENLEISLPEVGIEYIHLKTLGGRRPAKPGKKILPGKMLPFVAMQIIWKRRILKMP